MDDNESKSIFNLDTNVGTAIEAGRRLTLKARDNPIARGLPYVVLRDADGNERVEYLDREAVFADPPTGKKGAAIMHDMPSFLAYWREHKCGESRMYAEMEPAVKFTAVFDEHCPDYAGWREFRASYTPTHSKEWKAWTEKNGKAFDGNADFAIWLQDHLPDVVLPTGSELMDIITTLRVNETVAWKGATNLVNGAVDLGFNKIVDGHASSQGGSVVIPETLKLSVPVWTGLHQTLYDVDARFRYRLRDGVLRLWFELVRPHKVVEQAFEDLLASIRTSDAVLYFGSPNR